MINRMLNKLLRILDLWFLRSLRTPEERRRWNRRKNPLSRTGYVEVDGLG